MLFYISILTVLLIIILLISNWNRNKNSFFLAFFFFSMSSYPLVYSLAVDIKSDFLLAIFYNNITPIMLLSGPLLFFYLRGILNDKFMFEKKDAVHFIPFTIHLIGILPYVFSPFSQKLLVAQQIIHNIDSVKTIRLNIFFDPPTNFSIRITSLSLYLCYTIRMLWKFDVINKLKTQIPKKQFIITNRWLITLLGMTTIITAGFLMMTICFIYNSPSKVLVLLKPVYVTCGCIFILMSISLLFFPQVLYGMPVYIQKVAEDITLIAERTEILSITEPKVDNEINKSKQIEIEDEITENDPFNELAIRILEYVELERPFTKTDFSISSLAIELKVPHNHISYCFNNILKIKFTKFRNQHRVEYAKKLLTCEEHNVYTIDAILKLSGFSTRSNFYTVFKEITGLTPSEFTQSTF